MSVTTSGSGATAQRKSVWEGLWNRQLEHYPSTWPRMMYLGMTVIATVMLYYELYVIGGVSTFILADLHIGFSFFVYATAVGNLIGAFGSLFAGLTDRLGRTNLVVIGLIITGIFTLLIIPQATNKWELFIFLWIVGFVEGICLVATPALIRDFSPQTGRATALGFWTSAPVLGSLVVAVVASNTIPATAHPSSWTHQFHIAGVAGVIVAVMAIFILKELSPGLRDQLMVTMHDKALIEARAKGLDIEHLLHNPWRQLMKADVIVSAIGISVYLVIYYTFVAFGVIFFTTIFAFTVKDANGIGNWLWAFDAAGVILFGFISDAFRVRKPFMIIGGICTAIMTVIWLSQVGHHPGYYSLAIIGGVLTFTLGIAYVPWMASFTETVENHNPALTATGLAIWGWIIRVIVFIVFLIVPSVINTVTPLVNYGAGVQAAAAQYPTELAAVAAHPAVFTQLAANPSPANVAAAAAAVGPQTLAKIVQANNAPGNAALYGKGPNGKPLNSFQYALAHGAKVQSAAKHTDSQWKTWYWICFGCTIFFLLTVPIMWGRWSPRKARQDEREHDRMVDAEMERLHLAPVEQTPHRTV